MEFSGFPGFSGRWVVGSLGRCGWQAHRGFEHSGFVTWRVKPRDHFRSWKHEGYECYIYRPKQRASAVLLALLRDILVLGLFVVLLSDHCRFSIIITKEWQASHWIVYLIRVHINAEAQWLKSMLQTLELPSSSHNHQSNFDIPQQQNLSQIFPRWSQTIQSSKLLETHLVLPDPLACPLTKSLSIFEADFKPARKLDLIVISISIPWPRGIDKHTCHIYKQL